MKYDLLPVNGKVLLEKVELEIDVEKNDEPQFFFEGGDKLEYFKIVATAKECSYSIHKNDIVTVEHCTPIGVFDGIQLYICDEKFITCRILPRNEIKDTK